MTQSDSLAQYSTKHTRPNHRQDSISLTLRDELELHTTNEYQRQPAEHPSARRLYKRHLDDILTSPRVVTNADDAQQNLRSNINHARSLNRDLNSHLKRHGANDVRSSIPGVPHGGDGYRQGGFQRSTQAFLAPRWLRAVTLIASTASNHKKKSRRAWKLAIETETTRGCHYPDSIHFFSSKSLRRIVSR